MLRRLVLPRAGGYRWNQGLLFCRHPNDLVVQHKEQVANVHQSQTLENTNCHENTEMCTTMPVLIAYAKNFHYLLLYSTVVSTAILLATMFTKVHKDFIAMEFGLRAAVV